MKEKKNNLMKRKALAILLAGSMALSMTGCKGKDEKPKKEEYAIIHDDDTYIVLQIENSSWYYHDDTYEKFWSNGVEYTVPINNLYIVSSENAKEDALELAYTLAGEDGQVVDYEANQKKLHK